MATLNFCQHISAGLELGGPSSMVPPQAHLFLLLTGACILHTCNNSVTALLLPVLSHEINCTVCTLIEYSECGRWNRGGRANENLYTSAPQGQDDSLLCWPCPSRTFLHSWQLCTWTCRLQEARTGFWNLLQSLLLWRCWTDWWRRQWLPFLTCCRDRAHSPEMMASSGRPGNGFAICV